MCGMDKYLNIYIGTPRGIKSSVRYNSFRLRKAEEQSSLLPIKVEEIIKYVNEFLEKIGMQEVKFPKTKVEQINYEKIRKENGLKDKRDIVWLKFTRDGYLGVVATSNDINFDMPQSECEYKEKIRAKKWKYNTSGIIVHHLNKKWNESFLLIFPLINIPKELKRGDVERGIGNYLIDKGVPILDFYSHNY